MPKINVPFHKRLLFRVLLPVIIVGFLCSTLLVSYLSSPIKAFLNDQFDANLKYASGIGMQVCKDNFNYLLELRLENNSEMNQVLQKEAKDRIRDISLKFPYIHMMVVKSGSIIETCSMANSPEKLNLQLTSGQSDTMLDFNFNGNQIKSHIDFFPFWDWHIISFVTDEDYKSPVQMTYKIIYLSAVCVFLSILLTLFAVFHLFIKKPLNQINIATAEVAKGRFNKIEGIDDHEIGRLMISFNHMIDSLKKEKTAGQNLLNQLKESEALFRSQFEFGNIGIAITSVEDKRTIVNSRLCTMLGYDRKELEKISWEEITHSDDLKADLEQFEKIMAGEIDNYEIEKRIFNKNGKRLYVHVNVSCFRNPDQSVKFAIASILDITDRKESEEKQQRNANFTLALLNAIPTPVFYKDNEGRYQGCNKAFSDFMGMTAEQIKGKRVDELWPGEQAVVYHQKDLELIENPNHQVYEFKAMDKDSKIRPVIFTKDVFYDDKGEVAGIIGAFTDLTQVKEAEKARAETSRILRLVLDSIPVRVFWKDTESVYVGANKAFTRDAGLATPNDLIGKTDSELAFSAQAELFRQDDRTVMNTGKPKLFYEEPQDRPDGKTNWLLTSKVPMHDEKGRVIGVLGTYQDITKRKRAEEEIRNLRNYLANIIDSMPSILIGVNKDGRITQWNYKAFKITGISQESAHGKLFEEVFPRLSNEMNLIEKAIKDQQVYKDSRYANIQNNETIYEDITIYPLVSNGVKGAVIRIDDVTEQVRLEEMMVQSEKMLSVGGLAAGMAHEINNPLAGMMQTANVMKARLADLDMLANQRAADEVGISLEQIKAFMEKRSIFRMVNAINESGQRVTKIIDNMLSFARKSDAIVSTHNPVQLIERILELAATDYDLKKQYDFKTIKIIKEYEENLPTISCEGAKIQQVLLNLLRNGAQAMQSQDMDKGNTPCFILRLAREKSMLRIEVEDNGPGMDKQTQSKIFEPFFTTKPVGIGTGLGLSVSYFIITQNHSGTMEVVSSVGKGANFIIKLPLE